MTPRFFKSKFACHMPELPFASIAANHMAVFFWQNSQGDPPYFLCSVEEFSQDQQQHGENESQTACVPKVQDAQNC